MKTILHFKNGKFLPTTENWIYSSIQNIYNFDSIVYCNGRKNISTFPFLNARVFKRYNLPHQLTRCDPRLLLSLFKDRPALVHAHFASSGRDFLFYKKLYRIPMITSIYGVDITAAPEKREQNIKQFQPLFREGNLFLAMGNYMRKQLMSLGCPEEKIIVQPLGIDIAKIKFKSRKYLPGDTFKILMAARFTQKKGLPDAISAIGILVRQNPKLRVKVTVVGDSNGSEEDEKEKTVIKKTVRHFGLERIVRFTGFLDHDKLIELFYKNHVFLSPSVTADNGDNEGGYLMTALDAAASGMPVLSTLHCDIPDTIENGKSGFLVPEHRPDLLADHLMKFCSNGDILAKFGTRGREIVEKKFDITKLSKDLEQIYNSQL